MQRISLLRDEWQEFSSALTHEQFSKSDAWEEIFQASQVYSLECQELVVALMLEVNGDLVDGLTDCLSSEIVPRLEPAMQLAELKRVLAQAFDWALRFDFEQESELHQFWYVSEEKLEPRLGERFEEPGSERESPLDIARQAQALNDDLDGADDCECVASFVMRHPQHRHIVRRVQVADRYPYSEIRENLLANSCLPIDMLRCKLSFFGASKFDPKSDLWTRITMYQGAPLLDELDKPIVDDWWLPTLEID